MRMRIRYSKVGKVRFTSHRDSARHWERAVRKAGVRVAWSGGFTPRPRMSFGLALPTGAESRAEYLDVELEAGSATDEGELTSVLAAALPAGYGVERVVECPADARSLQEIVVACGWQLTLAGVTLDEVNSAVERALEATELPLERERKGQRSRDDIRPAVLALAAHDCEDVVLDATLATSGRGLRPLELVATLFPTFDPVDVAPRVLRTHQWADHDGELRDLVPL